MKTLAFGFLLLTISPIMAQKDTLKIQDSYSNLAVLMTDFVSNNFEGGIVYYLPKNNTDSLLFEIDYQEPSDFGSIQFKHLPSNKIVFRGKIVWNGLGKMEIPTELVKPSGFSTNKHSVKRPKQHQYYEYSMEFKSYRQASPKILASEIVIYGKVEYGKEFEKLNDLEDFLNRVWKSIEKLKVTGKFVQKKCSVGFYLYTPSVGEFDPFSAKWIIFLYIN